MNPRKVTEKLFDAWNKRDWDTIRRMLHPKYRYIAPDGQKTRGVEDGLDVAWKSFADGFPDGRVELNDIYVDGDVVVTDFTLTGTHKGTWEGIAPTGKGVTVDICNVMELKDGKVFKERDYLDTLGFFAQLGVVEMPSTSPA